ncbi:MAG: transporter tungsten-binding protein, partial [Dehalococcoidia bacterium]|nr:transporter tungsten-binding protein [Dehalococcoidia bacterium]
MLLERMSLMHRHLVEASLQMMWRLKRVSSLPIKAAMVIALLGGLLSCTSERASPVSPATVGETPVPQGERLRVATTTNLYDTGLWDYLEPMFKSRYGVELDIISGGTGKVLEYGRSGDVDVLTIHDKVQEEQFIAEGYGTQRYGFAYNYLNIVGPEGDPAGIRGMNPVEAFQELMKGGLATSGSVKFVSRGDGSGIHNREKDTWSTAGYEYETVRTSGPWYVEAGSGMGSTLVLANEKSAYTLTDTGTYLASRADLSLVPLVERGGALLNVYSAIPVNPKMHSQAQAAMTNNFV